MAAFQPRIVGISGPFKGTVLGLSQDPVSIGRDSSNHLWIFDPSLSRRHCSVIREGEQFKIQDLGSHNGTLVNGNAVQEQVLRHQDQICVGDSVLVFLEKEDELNLQRNPVMLTDTADLGTAATWLASKDAVYLQPRTAADFRSEERTARDLKSLLTIATGIGGIRDRESLEWQLLGMIFDVVPADRGAILHFGESLDEFESVTAWDRVRGPGQPVKVSRTVLKRVVEEKAGLLISDVAGESTAKRVDTLVQLGVHSVLCVPMTSDGNVCSAIYLDGRSPSEPFDEHHLQVMTAVAALGSMALENAHYYERLREENRLLRAEIDLEHNMVGSSPSMRAVYELIRRVAPSDSTVLICGESGTGKELVARALHRNSPRSNRPFVAINCAGLSETLLESELFGHEKGAFTGATTRKPGKLEVAEGGTLFLDEVSEMPTAIQPKLLRCLQEREFERLGGTTTIKADIRVIAATNKSLPEMVEAGTFRRDLYYRLNVVPVTMPALRERREDIPALAAHFIAKACQKCGSRMKQLSPEARSLLMTYDWPGNVRELENAIERAIVLGTADVILADDLPEAVLETGSAGASSSAKYNDALREFKRQLVVQALRQGNGNYLEAAQVLGLHPNSLLRLIRNLGLKTQKTGLEAG